METQALWFKMTAQDYTELNATECIVRVAWTDQRPMDVLSLFLSRPMNVDVNGLTTQHTRIRDLATRTR